MCALSVGFMSSVSFIFNVTFNLEVELMFNTIIMICLAAGTALLGRSGRHVSITKGDDTFNRNNHH